jgi:putative chitinase
MTPEQDKRLQTNLGVATDGIIGAGTLRAFFARMGAKVGLSVELGLAANVHFRTYGILDHPDRLAHFMGQCAHESGGFVFMEEIWGPTAAQRSYEGRASLGNTVPGDGFRYKGRGPIQLTGRANYRRYGRDIGIDLETHPEIAAIPSIGLLTACKYWSDNGLNELADFDDLEGITRRINGGTNGLDDRIARTSKAKGLVG